jgi:hypothetical protein
MGLLDHCCSEAGAGKSNRCGLIIKNLKFRGLADHVLCVTPANRTDPWRCETHDKSGETFDAINRATVNAAFGRYFPKKESLGCRKNKPDA